MDEIKKQYLVKEYQRHLALRNHAYQVVNQSAREFLKVIDFLKETENVSEAEITEVLGEDIFSLPQNQASE